MLTLLGACTTRIAAQSGSQDSSFNAAIPVGEIGSSVAVQPDGKVVASGTFGVVRLLSDGSLDPTFHTPLLPAVESPISPGQRISAVGVDPDGKVLVTGNFTNAAGAPFPVLLRLNVDGTVDPSFNLDPRAYPNGRDLALQPDRKVVTSGTYYDAAHQEYGGALLRLRPDGSLDPDFDSRELGNGGGATVLGLASDGKIYFLSSGLGRANADGSLDDTFQADLDGKPFSSLAVRHDGEVIIGGYSDGMGFRSVRRLLTSGADDPDWTPPDIGGGDAVVLSLLVQPDGKVLAGGNNLQSFNGMLNANLGRLNPDGSVDTTFDTRGDLYAYTVEDMALAPDGKVLVAGYQLYRSDYSAGPGIWRLNNDVELQPRLDLSVTASQSIAVRLRGAPGATYRLEYRESLAVGGSWTSLATLTLTGGEATWEDTSSTGSTMRFYRAVSLP